MARTASPAPEHRDDYRPAYAARARAEATRVLRACEASAADFYAEPTDAELRGDEGPAAKNLHRSGALSSANTPARAAGAGARVLRDISAANAARPSALAKKTKRTPRSRTSARTPTSSCLM